MSASDYEFILSIATRKRFAATFWRELARRRKEDPDISRRQVFQDLEDLFEETFGEILWDYDCFRHSKEFKGRI